MIPLMLLQPFVENAIWQGLKVTSQRIEMMNKLNSTGAQVNIFDLKDDQGNATGTKVEVILPY